MEKELAPPPTPPPPPTSRIDEILAHYSTSPTTPTTPLPAHLRRPPPTPSELEELEASLANHPFFITQEQLDALPPHLPLPPLLDALQQLKYSPLENTPLQLALNYKADGLFQFQHGKWRIAAALFSEGIRCLGEGGGGGGEGGGGEGGEGSLLPAQLYNNRGVCQFHVGNYASALGDFQRALAILPNYAKSWKKAMECCVKLARFPLGLEILTTGLAHGLADESGMKQQLDLGLRTQLLAQSRAQSAQKSQHREFGVVLERVVQSGVQLLNPNFLEAAESDARVKVGPDGGLIWPVLLYYPEYSTSDFVKEFGGGQGFAPHLQTMLDLEPPAWDKNGDYKSNSVDIYYVDGVKGGWVKVTEGKLLGDVMREERYWLPTNGVPGFFILAKNSEFCRFFLERME